MHFWIHVFLVSAQSLQKKLNLWYGSYEIVSNWLSCQLFTIIYQRFDGQKTIFIRNLELYVKSKSSGNQFQLTWPQDVLTKQLSKSKQLPQSPLQSIIIGALLMRHLAKELIL